MRSNGAKFLNLLAFIALFAGCAKDQYLTKAAQPETVPGYVLVDAMRSCLASRRAEPEQSFNLCKFGFLGSPPRLIASIFNKSGGLVKTLATSEPEFSNAAIGRMRSREIVDLLDLVQVHSPEATLTALSESLVCSRLTDVAQSDGGALVLSYASENELCPRQEIQRALLRAMQDDLTKVLKTTSSLDCFSNTRPTPVEIAKSRLLTQLATTGEFEATSIALRALHSNAARTNSCGGKSWGAVAHTIVDQGSQKATLKSSVRVDASRSPTRQSTTDWTLFDGSHSITQVRSSFVSDPSTFTANIDLVCANLGGIRLLTEPSNRNIQLSTMRPGCYSLSASSPTNLIGEEAESAAGVIIILRRGSFKLVETSKSGAIIVAPKLRNAAAMAPKIYGFPVFFYLDKQGAQSKEVMAFHWISSMPTREDGAYNQAEVTTSQIEPLAFVDQSPAAVARLLSPDDMSEIRLDLAGPALGVSFGGVFGTPLRILANAKDVCQRIKDARLKRYSIVVPNNWDEALTPNDRTDRSRFCPSENVRECFEKVLNHLECKDDVNYPLPASLTVNATKFRLGTPR